MADEPRHNQEGAVNGKTSGSETFLVWVFSGFRKLLINGNNHPPPPFDMQPHLSMLTVTKDTLSWSSRSAGSIGLALNVSLSTSLRPLRNPQAVRLQQLAAFYLTGGTEGDQRTIWPVIQRFLWQTACD